MAVQEADDSEPEDEDSYQEAAEKQAQTEGKRRSTKTSGSKMEVSWVGDIIVDDGRRKFYKYIKSIRY